VVDQIWANTAGTPVDEYTYGYDASGNRLWKENVVSKAQATPVYLEGRRGTGPVLTR
jgi:hypothetical protein